MSDDLEMLYFYSDIIVNTDNDIIYNGGSHEFLTAISDIFFNELSRILCDQLGWNIFEIEVEIT
jgi:hypothetical protein